MLSTWVGKKFRNVLLTFLFIFPAVLASADEKHDPKRVLTIFVFKQGLPWAYRIEESLRTALASETSFPIDLNVEHADLSRFSDKAYLSKLVNLYRYKYSKQKIDLLIAIGDESTDLLIVTDRTILCDGRCLLDDYHEVQQNYSLKKVYIRHG